MTSSHGLISTIAYQASTLSSPLIRRSRDRSLFMLLKEVWLLPVLSSNGFVIIFISLRLLLKHVHLSISFMAVG